MHRVALFWPLLCVPSPESLTCYNQEKSRKSALPNWQPLNIKARPWDEPVAKWFPHEAVKSLPFQIKTAYADV